MKMKRHIMVLSLAVSCLLAVAGPTTIKATMDSTTLLMGKVSAIHVEIVQDEQVQGFLLADRMDTLQAMVEIAARPKPDTTRLGNGRVQINRDIVVQSFDSGAYVLPPLAYVVGHDTLRSGALSLKVMPVQVDSLATIHDLKPVATVPFKLGDWLPDFITDYWWAWLLLLALAAAAFVLWLKWLRKGRNPFVALRKRLPPYDEAMLNLRNLKARNLWQNGMEKEYFTQLTDILRVYINRRFDINAVEMTTTQIMETLKDNGEAQAGSDQLSMILEMADYVKFAAVRPLADDNEQAFRRAVNFIEATKPVEVKTESQTGEEVTS